ncbi:hypothetical protein [Paracoccus sp. (in: a-proteobacteria)]|uniref:hypothetical protein n=1 Tax=Paracoccus sp. TaxID=267 RepID=UPI00396C9084
MTHAILTFEGHAPIEGTIEAGGDYIKFRTQAELSENDMGSMRNGTIEIEGKSETVLLESAHPHRAVSGIEPDEDCLQLTLRRHSPPIS